LEWDDKLEAHKVQLDIDKLSHETKGMKLREHGERVIKGKTRKLRDVQSECRARSEKSFSNLSVNTEKLKSERYAFEQKIKKAHDKIDQ